jgi:mannose-6-phosphate isomerase-like protein (cupin superfamily)
LQAFETTELQRQRQASDGPWIEFLRVPSLSMGLYELSAGGADPQQPHTEDEVYYVVRGSATINVAGEDRPVQAGSIIFVGAHVPHRFHSIRQDLSVLVFFAPAEYSAGSVNP